MNYIRFSDEYKVAPIKVAEAVKDYYNNLQIGQVARPLQVKFAATHAGKVTRKNGLYLPHEMRTGVPSWTDQYAKPILLHHEDHDDPIGRVAFARYVDISMGIRNSYEKRGQDLTNVNRIGLRVLDALVGGNLSFKESIDVVTRYLINDQTLLEDPDYEGLGFIELTTHITDVDAIQKFLDGRYLTGSVGATTNKAVCSICRKDWAGDDGQCEHRPGGVYEGKKAVLIAGKLSYDEYSVVNRPADRHSRVIEININGVQDFVQLDTEVNGVILNDSIPEITFSVVDSVEEGNMPELVEDKVPDQKQDVVPPVVDPIVPEPPKVTDVVLPEPEKVEPVVEVEVKDEVVVPPVVENQEGVEPDLQGVELVQLLKDIKVVLVERQTEAAAHTTLQNRVKELELALVATVSVEDKSKLVATQEELKVAYNDFQELQDKYADTLLQLRSAREARICLLESLVKKDFSVETRIASFSDKSLEDIGKILDETEKSVDLVQVRSILTNDAIVSEPPKKVEDPTLQRDNAKKLDQEQEKVRARVMKQYLEIRKVDRNQAEAYLQVAQSKGLIKG